jgi:hypothetical protein
MTLKDVATLVLGLLPVIYSAAFGHETDLVKVAETLEATAADLRSLVPTGSQA